VSPSLSEKRNDAHVKEPGLVFERTKLINMALCFHQLMKAGRGGAKNVVFFTHVECVLKNCLLMLSVR